MKSVIRLVFQICVYVMVFCLLVKCSRSSSRSNSSNTSASEPAPPATPPPTPPIDNTTNSEASFDVDGVHYEVIHGILFQGVNSGPLTQVQALYDPDFYQKNYALENGKLFRISGSDKYPVKDFVKENFDQVTTIKDLIGLIYGWTEFTLLAPATPTIAAYSDLRNKILNGTAAFIDNRVEPSKLKSHSGTMSLRTYSVKSGPEMLLTKASLTTTLVLFKKGENFWYSGWYYLEKGHPWSLVDLECSFIDQSGGMRLMLTDDLHPYFELKWPTRPRYYPEAINNIALPSAVWTHVVVHLYLSDGSDGISQLWIDEKLVIDGHGQNLPLAKLMYDSLEVGISSNPPQTETTLYVDDIDASHLSLRGSH